MFNAGYQFFIVMASTILCHQLGADVENFSARNDNRCIGNCELVE